MSDTDWAIGCKVIQWDGKSILLERPNGERRRLEYVGETELEKENEQLRKDRRDLCILLGRDNSDRTLTEIVQDLLDISERLRSRLAALEAVIPEEDDDD